MDDLDPPSFSLGLDLDVDPDSPLPTLQHQEPPPPGSTSSTFLDDGDEEDFGPRVMDSEEEEEDDKIGLQVMDSDPESGSDPPRVLKRLRRGGGRTQVEESGVKKREEEFFFSDNGNDDIEEFSSQEDLIRGAQPSTQHNSVCSSSKVPLRGSGVLTAQSSVLRNGTKREPASDVPASSSLERGQNGLMFPKLTISPLRRFQLIDSDSDSEDPCISDVINRTTQKVDSSSVEYQTTASGENKKSSLDKQQNEDLWRDFHPMKSFCVPTPVLDEFCEEYFQSVGNKDSAQKWGNEFCTSETLDGYRDANTPACFEQSLNSADNPIPPAHHYFFHDDPRVQKLVQSRLPNFSPLGIAANRRNKQPMEPMIDYVCQFNQGASKQNGTERGNSKKGSTRRRSKSKSSNAKEISNSSQGWVDPKSTATTPKDAAKRRVQANGQPAASGHWYTSPDGRRVYVSRSGQEMTGKIAYVNYRKDNGGFRKSKKKTNARRKK